MNEEGPLGKQAIPEPETGQKAGSPVDPPERTSPSLLMPSLTLVDFCYRELSDNNRVFHHLVCYSSSGQLIHANHLALRRSSAAF